MTNATHGSFKYKNDTFSGTCKWALGENVNKGKINAL